MTLTVSIGRETKDEHLVVFRLANEFFGADIECVREIILWQNVTALPKAKDFVEGIINLRGSITPVIDLRSRFGLPNADTADTRIMVVELLGPDATIGLVVDAVTEVLRVPRTNIEPFSTHNFTGTDVGFFRAVAKVNGRLVLIMDLAELLDEQEQHALQQLKLEE